jgi:hypothetical protein
MWFPTMMFGPSRTKLSPPRRSIFLGRRNSQVMASTNFAMRRNSSSNVGMAEDVFYRIGGRNSKTSPRGARRLANAEKAC